MRDTSLLQSPLNGFSPGHFQGGPADIQCLSVPFVGKLLIKLPRSNRDTMERLGSVLGGPLPQRHSLTRPVGRILALGPSEWLLLLKKPEDLESISSALQNALNGASAAILDFSSGLHLLRLSGPAAETLLQMSMTLDLDRQSFPADHVARSRYDKYPVTVVRVADSAFDVLVARSFARSFTDYLLKRSKLWEISYSESQTGRPDDERCCEGS